MGIGIQFILGLKDGVKADYFGIYFIIFNKQKE